jgi:AcrR family transcriptional regulator
MRDLARAVGVTEGAFYRHFDSKEALVAELFAAEASRLHGWLSRCLKSESEPWSRFDALVAGFVEFGLEESESFRLIMEMHHLANLKTEPAGMPRDLFIKVLRELAATEKSRLAEPMAVVLMLVGLLSRSTTALRRGVLRLPRARFVRLIREAARAVVLSALEPID